MILWLGLSLCYDTVLLVCNKATLLVVVVVVVVVHVVAFLWCVRWWFPNFPSCAFCVGRTLLSTRGTPPTTGILRLIPRRIMQITSPQERRSSPHTTPRYGFLSVFFPPRGQNASHVLRHRPKSCVDRTRRCKVRTRTATVGSTTRARVTTPPVTSTRPTRSTALTR